MLVVLDRDVAALIVQPPTALGLEQRASREGARSCSVNSYGLCCSAIGTEGSISERMPAGKAPGRASTHAEPLAWRECLRMQCTNLDLAEHVGVTETGSEDWSHADPQEA